MLFVSVNFFSKNFFLCFFVQFFGRFGSVNFIGCCFLVLFCFIVLVMLFLSFVFFFKLFLNFGVFLGFIFFLKLFFCFALKDASANLSCFSFNKFYFFRLSKFKRVFSTSTRKIEHIIEEETQNAYFTDCASLEKLDGSSYTIKFLDSVKKALNLSAFKESEAKQREIQEKLNQLFLNERNWYQFTSGGNELARLNFKNLYKKEVLSFDSIFRSFLQKETKSSIFYKFKFVVTNLVDGFLPLTAWKYVPNELVQVLGEHLKVYFLNASQLSLDLMLPILKTGLTSAWDLKKGVFFVVNTVIWRSVKNTLKKLIKFLIFSFFEQFFGQEKTEKIKAALMHMVSRELAESESLNKQIVGIGKLFLIILENAGFLKEPKTVRLSGKKTQTIFKLDPKCVSIVISGTHLPQVVKPDLSKNLQAGDVFSRPKSELDFNCNLTESTKSALQLMSEKKFSINPNFYKVVAYINNLDPQSAISLNLPFCSNPELLALNEAFEKKFAGYELPLAQLNEAEAFKKMYKNLEALSFLEYRPKESELSFLAYKFSGFNEKERIFYLFYKKQKVAKIEGLASNNFFNEMVALSKPFLGFPLYFENFFDYRLRVYPSSWLFSRTAGVFKYLVRDFTKVKLTLEGFYIFLLAYFNHASSSKVLALKALYQENCSFAQLKKFFIKNKLCLMDLSVTGNFVYFKLLEFEIMECFLCNYATSFMVEIDQKSSSSVI